MKRSVPAIVMTLLTLFAAAGGVGTNRAIRGLVELPEGVSAPAVTSAEAMPGREASPAPRPAARSRTKKQYIDDILARNIFDPDAIGRESEEFEEMEEGDVVTDLDLVLIGTMVAVPETFSSAFIAESKKEGKGQGYGIGQKVLDAEIIKIESRKVHLKRANGQIEILSMDEEDKSVRASSEPSPAGEDADGEDAQIEQVSETKFIVERDLVDKYLGNLDGIARMGRAIPHRGADGDIDGYRLSGIRRNTVGQKLGIKNGDIVHGVNGQSLTSMQGAMAAFSSLQSESSFSFEVTRRGQKMTLEYEVR